MCGICGIIHKDIPLIPPPLVEAMSATMVKRGPNGYGEYYDTNVGMGMRRLSIIDLKQGWQPLFSADRQIVAFQNGEIYNYQTLQQELQSNGYTFLTHSDTEVLAHGFAAWGIEGLLQRIDGMYALAIYDQRQRKIYLARDRFGEKPLFYVHTSDFFAYSSNTIALNILPWVESNIHRSSLAYYLALHYIPGEQTIFEQIKRVLPGEYLCIYCDSLQMQISKYYTIPLRKPTKPLHAQQVAERIEESVTSRLIADVPVGIFLSGGLDSSVIAAIAAKQHPQIDTFSMGFHAKAVDESVYAQQVATMIQSRHHHFYFDEQAFLELVPQVAIALDEPVGDQALLPLYWLCREAKKHVTVVLSGEGGDEIFGGYGYYEDFAEQPNVFETIKRKLWRTPKNFSVNLNTLINNSKPITPSGFPLLTDQQTRIRLLGSNEFNESFEMQFIDQLNCTYNPLQRATMADMRTWLPDDLLIKFDRMAMAHSLEGRAPYLQPEIVEIGLNLPSKEKIWNGNKKRYFKGLASSWLPDTIIHRRKQGFILPMRQWICQWFEQYGSAKTYFTRSSIADINMTELITIVNDDLNNGIVRERLLFALILLMEWHVAYKKRISEQKMSKNCIFLTY
ncbi:asparagine synthase (Glutamine-hydrolyzing) [Candidatus Moduliflexus flocculans]|uniref:asparagine synthase (glutamine-hydrolyzing) n=1 Tax=Candidatus Moduliflexus flocculans TaxID=1499966 RepID=A0A081BRQ5_9BACT|nr:asparagine synthase (Glutamine-hydrolyzing) [Candidatus Moduliflexus flocculans]